MFRFAVFQLRESVHISRAAQHITRPCPPSLPPGSSPQDQTNFCAAERVCHHRQLTVWQLQRLVLGGPQQPVAQSLGAPPRAPAILGHLSPADPQLLVLARLVKQGNVPREGVLVAMGRGMRAPASAAIQGRQRAVSVSACGSLCALGTGVEGRGGGRGGGAHFEEHRVPERAAPGVLRHPVCRPPGTRLRLRRIVREARHPDACPVHPLPLAAKPRGDHLSRRCLGAAAASHTVSEALSVPRIPAMSRDMWRDMMPAHPAVDKSGGAQLEKEISELDLIHPPPPPLFNFPGHKYWPHP